MVAAQVSGTFSCLNSSDQSLSGIVTFGLGPASLLSLVSCMCPISSTLKIDVATTSTRDFDTLERVIFNIFFFMISVMWSVPRVAYFCCSNPDFFLTIHSACAPRQAVVFGGITFTWFYVDIHLCVMCTTRFHSLHML